jgi:hypothetical protein
MQCILVFAIEQLVAIELDHVAKEGVLDACFRFVVLEGKKRQPSLSSPLQFTAKGLRLRLQDLAKRGNGIITAMAISLICIILTLHHLQRVHDSLD